nr:MAG TPA: hypothetical protein [Caudoviricetes sp.]
MGLQGYKVYALTVFQRTFGMFSCTFSLSGVSLVQRIEPIPLWEGLCCHFVSVWL